MMRSPLILAFIRLCFLLLLFSFGTTDQQMIMRTMSPPAAEPRRELRGRVPPGGTKKPPSPVAPPGKKP
ncbi:hypothetical protein H6P81_019765 [Aristolochia fimbriata]|uniref:Secreted protein n=1 Tax=Aristolochia fimbriata TaxID=158543 RepID=A0AAV7DUG4_ARIFI|nr:hypothetical protein H6P81_019765 [Aristolochia fimbriata]